MKLAEKCLDEHKRPLETDVDRENWVVDAWNASKGTSGLLCLIPEWKNLPVTIATKRQDEWYTILKKYYCIRYCEKVNQWTKPPRVVVKRMSCSLVFFV